MAEENVTKLGHTKEPPYNAPLAISKSGRILHVTIGGGLELFSTRDSLHTVVEQIVNSYNACAGMADPEAEIRKMREALEFIAQQPCYGETGDFAKCFDVSPSLCVTEFCLACYAKAALHGTP